MEDETTSEVAPVTEPTPPPPPTTVPPQYFESLYQTSPDPWNFESSEYDQARHEAMLKALPRDHYKSGFEIGCSVGVLTAKLAPRCEALLAIDASQLALQKAKVRCQEFSQVHFEQMHVPTQFPEAQFDLTILAEVGYYLTHEDLLTLRQKIVAQLETGGTLMLVHWIAPVEQNPLTGDVVHDVFMELADSELRHMSDQRDENHRLDVFERV